MCRGQRLHDSRAHSAGRASRLSRRKGGSATHPPPLPQRRPQQVHLRLPLLWRPQPGPAGAGEALRGQPPQRPQPRGEPAHPRDPAPHAHGLPGPVGSPPPLCPRCAPSARPCPGAIPATRAPTSCSTCSTGTSSPTTLSWWVTRLAPPRRRCWWWAGLQATRGPGVWAVQWAPHPRVNQLSSLGVPLGEVPSQGYRLPGFALRPGDRPSLGTGPSSAHWERATSRLQTLASWCTPRPALPVPCQPAGTRPCRLPPPLRPHLVLTVETQECWLPPLHRP